jgi:hypothetical protein
LSIIEFFEVEINIFDDEADKLTRKSAMLFNVASVSRPLASSAKVAEAGNLIVLAANGGFIENLQTKKRIAVRKERGTLVMNAEYANGELGVITLDSGAGPSAWPEKLQREVAVAPNKEGLKKWAANLTSIANLGTKLNKFRGIESLEFKSGA